ncbi:MAG: ribosome-associated translation inhibitor RaiA [Bacilli bacterium]|nr:ribosome-associated translation inhibitor RaiA [Bacilli bacterium]
MKYQIIGKNIEVTEGISTALQNKLTRLDKYFLVKEDVECRCVVSAHNLIQKVEITVFLPNMPIRAEVENADLYAGIDLAIDKLEGQMRKIKTRMDRSNNRLSLGKAIDFEMIDEDEEVSKEKDVIVRAKSYYLQAMSIDEAITRMEALGHPFFMYLDEEDDRISTVYIRRDGGYGVIQAENPIK